MMHCLKKKIYSDSRSSPKKDNCYPKHSSSLSCASNEVYPRRRQFSHRKHRFLFVSIFFCSVPVSHVLFLNRNFVEEKLGAKYVERTRLDLGKAFGESSPGTPVFFILSPGVDALKDLEVLGE